MPRRPTAVVKSRDPRTGKAVETLPEESSSAEVARLVALALSAAPVWDAMGRAGRAALLGPPRRVSYGVRRSPNR
ncbi:hypothetical protein [Streptomyces inhibens]|uniref:hypothetical protein n=1 Tax=Streptomyces inhibens TaxID=2293571 RepID=UPI001EE70CA2|nr:hypothetical protein [Streptomyces inhibens]UKY54471.1 hypothetical protein KI385_40495 [Streptomyces inhibens]